MKSPRKISFSSGPIALFLAGVGLVRPGLMGPDPPLSPRRFPCSRMTPACRREWSG